MIIALRSFKALLFFVYWSGLNLECSWLLSNYKYLNHFGLAVLKKKFRQFKTKPECQKNCDKLRREIYLKSVLRFLYSRESSKRSWVSVKPFDGTSWYWGRMLTEMTRGHTLESCNISYKLLLSSESAGKRNVGFWQNFLNPVMIALRKP